MRWGQFCVMLLAATFMAAGTPAMAQMKIQGQPRILLQPKMQGQPKIQGQPRIQRQLRINKRPVVGVKPKIPLADATRRIMQAFPTAKVLDVRPSPNGDIIVKIRDVNQVRRIRVDGQTGAVHQ